MITDVVQRWTERRASYRPAREVVSTRALEAVPIGSAAVARAFVERHHYAGTASSTAHRFALHMRGELVGVALFGPPASMGAHRAVWPMLGAAEAVSLGRFVLVDSVGANAESWFIARCFDLLRARSVVGVESCADPRWGHVGTIYQATNGHYVGRTNRSTLRLFEDGREFSARAASKVRCGEQGRRYAIAQLVARGAAAPDPDEDIRAWLRRWTATLTRPLRHDGKHRYLWCLDRRRAHEVLRAPARPYPKLGAEG